MCSNTELMEQCVQRYNNVKIRCTDRQIEQKSSVDIAAAFMQDQVQEIQAQSAFRGTQGKDGGYGQGSGSGSGKRTTFEVRHTTSEEEDFDSDADKSDDEKDENEDQKDAAERRANRAENKRLNELAKGGHSAKVLHRRKNGKIIERDQNGNENRAQQKAEGDVKETGEKKRRDDANRAAANKANKAAEAAQKRRDDADWGRRGTESPYYVDLGIYM